MTAEDTLQVEADFKKDWADYLVAQLTELGCHVDPTREFHELAIAFFNALARRIHPTPREVLISREFVCPTKHRHVVDAIREKVERGADLTPHLSAAIERHSDVDDDLFNDGLLNDWGIHHLHLGTAPHPKYPSFVVRTDDVLFARVTDEAFYLITVMPHRQWANQELFEIIHRNWPDSIRRFRLPGVVKIDPVWSNEAIPKLRKGGVMTMIQMKDGTVYRPIGGGITTSQVGAEVADRAGYYTHLVGWLERYVREHGSELVAQAAAEGHSLSSPLRLRFVAFMSGSALIIEDNSKVMFSIPTA
jgi:hypothetical protein